MGIKITDNSEEVKAAMQVVKGVNQNGRAQTAWNKEL